jgi:hypothetical protein
VCRRFESVLRYQPKPLIDRVFRVWLFLSKVVVISAAVKAVVRNSFMSSSYKHCPVTPCASGTIHHEQFRVGFSATDNT